MFWCVVFFFFYVLISLNYVGRILLWCCFGFGWSLVLGFEDKNSIIFESEYFGEWCVVVWECFGLVWFEGVIMKCVFFSVVGLFVFGLEIFI